MKENTCKSQKKTHKFKVLKFRFVNGNFVSVSNPDEWAYGDCILENCTVVISDLETVITGNKKVYDYIDEREKTECWTREERREYENVYVVNFKKRIWQWEFPYMKTIEEEKEILIPGFCCKTKREKVTITLLKNGVIIEGTDDIVLE